MATLRISKNKKIKVVDLFCGIGGLTHGLVLEGLDVVAGVDNDETCKYAFEKNNGSKFICKDIVDFSSEDLKKIYNDASIKVLVGCAPCQPFSALNRNKSVYKSTDANWTPLYRFMALIKGTNPHIVSMENVPDLSDEKKYPVFGEFIENLKSLGYKVSYKKVDVSKYGVPQKRKRLVLLASLFGELELIPETHTEENLVTVRKAIEQLPPIDDGESDSDDKFHRASKLSELNKKRIKATPKDGGSAKSWSKDLLPDCYKKESGRTFMCSVYGRMKWDKPAPTMTAHCLSLGTGRYGHPSQNRAISLREAGLFQSFPAYYEFDDPKKIHITKSAKHVGNAVPVLLGQAIAKSIKIHLHECGKI